MNYFDPYVSELQLVFTEAKRRIALFPEPFDKAGLVYLSKFDVFEKEAPKTIFVTCFLTG